MICPKCSREVDEKTKYCIVCGTNLNFEYNNNYSENSQNNIKLVDEYIGNNSNKLKSGFSFCSFLFGPIYLLYRKMWLLGFIWIVINIILSFLVPYYIYLSLILSVLMGCFFKQLYLNHVKKKVAKIEMENIGRTDNELINICKNKGGTTIVPIVLIIIFFVIIIILLPVSIYFIAKDITDEIIDDAQEEVKQRTAEQVYKKVNVAYFNSYLIDSDVTINDIKENYQIDNEKNIYLYNQKSLKIIAQDGVECTVINKDTNYFEVDCGEYLEGSPKEITNK